MTDFLMEFAKCACSAAENTSKSTLWIYQIRINAYTHGIELNVTANEWKALTHLMPDACAHHPTCDTVVCIPYFITILLLFTMKSARGNIIYAHKYIAYNKLNIPIHVNWLRHCSRAWIDMFNLLQIQMWKDPEITSETFLHP